MKSAVYMQRLMVYAILIMLLFSPAVANAATVIVVDSDCSLANAIRSANGEAQLEEAGDDDGNDDCEAGTAPDESANPPETGQDIIRLSADIVLAEKLPILTTPIQLEGNGRSISGNALYSGFDISGAAVSVSDLTITNTASNTFGGAIHVLNGELTLTGIVITASQAGDIGGGIYASDSNVTITDSRLSRNSTSKSHGGGIYFVSADGSHSLSLVRSILDQNAATEDGGALKAAGGTVSIVKSTFSQNSSDEGGAVEASNVTLDIANSTFSNNSAREGGGLSSFGSDVTLTHTTWAYNTAAEQGGSIAIIGWTGSFKIRNTLITDSGGGGDCHHGPNEDIIVEFTGNFIQDGTCTPEPPAVEPEAQAALETEAEAESEAADAEAQADAGVDADAGVVELEAQHLPDEEEHDSLGDAMIANLQGSLLHHPLQWGSPAIDGGDPVYCLDDDQINTERPQYDNCDIGAYEYPKPPDPTPEPEDDDDPDPDPDPPVTPATPGPGPTPDPQNVCVPAERIIVHTANDDLKCEPVDIITLDKHPVLQGGRFAARLWRSSSQCLHRVAADDNLYRLAIQYQTTVDSLRSLNALVGNQLSVGQNLLLPRCVSDGSLAFENTRICFENQGNLVFIDSSTAPPQVSTLEKYLVNGMTCANVDRPGVIVLTALDS